MIQLQDVIAFFDSRADTWDAGMVRNETVISDENMYQVVGKKE